MEKYFKGFASIEVTNSSNITAIGYDIFNMTLRVLYRGNACYDYSNVVADHAIELNRRVKRNCGSVGGYIATNIKDSHPYERAQIDE